MGKEADVVKIIKEERITTVFQPIVSLENGSVFGYEALSRISLVDCKLNIEELFELAHRTDKLWDLEKICRKKALKNAAAKPGAAMIFLNVDANIIHDQEFREGFTAEKLHKHGIPEKNIIFEITEKTAIANKDLFTSSVLHYQNQNFKIAIDDFGSGYSGLNRVCSISPDYLKIDMQLVRNIHADVIKKSAVAAIVSFCNQTGIKVIAEGIETELELKTLIGMGIHYGQGYYLCRPNKEFMELTSEQKFQIKGYYNKMKLYSTGMVFAEIVDLAEKKEVARLTDDSFVIFEKMKMNNKIAEFFVVDEEDKVCGVLTRRGILERFGGQFGYTLSKRTTVTDICQTDFLVVEENLSIDRVAELAMQRTVESVYDSIAVVREGKYIGTVSVKDLLLSSIQVQLKRASDANPLTGLPGNHQIQQVIGATFAKTESWAIVYLDLDNFKAYNDEYGFSNGDLMIKAVARAMETCCNDKEFFGHIGGDDFVVVANHHRVLVLCERIVANFETSIQTLYSPEDWERGFIISKNRNGFTENFHIASLSIAVVTNQNVQPKTMEALSRIIAETKKTAKKKEGNAIIIV